MTPWTALLESLHSALIDELTERHPEPKPGLGVPLRQKEFAAPGPEIVHVLACQVSFDQGRGHAFLALDAKAAKILELNSQELWDSLIKRAGAEFSRRSIRPKLATPVHLMRSETLDTLPAPAWSHPPQRVVWIPFSLGEGKCFLGLAA
jgi:hypothetical protein